MLCFKAFSRPYSLLRLIAPLILSILLTACNGGSGKSVNTADENDDTEQPPNIIIDINEYQTPQDSTLLQVKAYLTAEILDNASDQAAESDSSPETDKGYTGRLIVERQSDYTSAVFDWPETGDQSDGIMTSKNLRFLLESGESYRLAIIVRHNASNKQFTGQLDKASVRSSEQINQSGQSFEIPLYPVAGTELTLPGISEEFAHRLISPFNQLDLLTRITLDYPADALSRLTLPVISWVINDQQTATLIRETSQPLALMYLPGDETSHQYHASVYDGYSLSSTNLIDTTKDTNEQSVQLQTQPVNLEMTINFITADPAIMTVNLPQPLIRYINESPETTKLAFSLSDGQTTEVFEPELTELHSGSKEFVINKGFNGEKLVASLALSRFTERINCADSAQYTGDNRFQCLLALPLSDRADFVIPETQQPSVTRSVISVYNADNKPEPAVSIYVDGRLQAITGNDGRAEISHAETSTIVVADQKTDYRLDSVTSTGMIFSPALTFENHPYQHPDYPTPILGEGRHCSELYQADNYAGNGLYRLDPDGYAGPLSPFITHCLNGGTLIRNSGRFITEYTVGSLKQNTLLDGLTQGEELDYYWQNENNKAPGESFFGYLSDAHWNALKQEADYLKVYIPDDSYASNQQGRHEISIPTDVPANQICPSLDNTLSLKANSAARYHILCMTADGISFPSDNPLQNTTAYQQRENMWSESPEGYVDIQADAMSVYLFFEVKQ